ncbi:MAG TPA: hypothetical protein VIC82_10710 [Candidatus Nanopelagicales bacterium]|jgi:hypothetical protein
MTGRRFTTGRTVRIATALAAVATAIVVPAALDSESALAVAPAAAAGHSYVVSTVAQLKARIPQLRAGDTLRLQPGTYNTGYLRYYASGANPTQTIARGTAARPITVTSVNPSRPAVLVGGFQLTGANYWHLTRLRFQAATAGLSALYMNNGVGWQVTYSEFWGADKTRSFANVAIAGSRGEPRAFVFAGNCLHGAAATNRGNTDQNIYLSFQGTAASGGSIARNIIWASPQGAAIKLGNGGVSGALGPWNVAVTNNTLASNGRQILFFGNVRNNRIYGNLFYKARTPFTHDPRTTQIYVAGRVGSGNVIKGNYGYGASMFSFDPTHSLHYGANTQSNAAAANPSFFSQNGCTAYRPTSRTAASFGRYGVIH